MSKIEFYGETKLIVINDGYTSINVKEELYSVWKDWAITGLNSQWEQAFSSTGGDDLGGGQFLGGYFFLENGWKIRPHEADHILDITGNLFSRDGSNPFVSTLGSYNVLIRSAFSSLTQALTTEGNSFSLSDIQAIIATAVPPAVWEQVASFYQGNGTFGRLIKEAADNSELAAIK